VVQDPAARAAWLGRYPELVRAFRRIVPGMSRSGDKQAVHPARMTRAQMRALLAERGIPVRVFARPHEMFVTKTPDEAHEYIPVHVIHINPAGALAKIEMQRRNGTILQAEIPKNILDSLAIRRNDQLFVRPKNVRVFE
jgi:ABC-type sulfate/molybdate transport systems ATPase subunit